MKRMFFLIGFLGTFSNAMADSENDAHGKKIFAKLSGNHVVAGTLAMKFSGKALQENSHRASAHAEQLSARFEAQIADRGTWLQKKLWQQAKLIVKQSRKMLESQELINSFKNKILWFGFSVF